MNKLSSAARTTEIDAFSDAIVAVFDADKKVYDDAFLQKTFSQIKKLSDDITESVKRTKAKSPLAACDKKRCDAFRALGKIIEGYAANPISELSAAGAVLKKIFDKYGLKTLLESFSNKSSFIESMLMDFKKEKAAQAVKKLLGAQEAVEKLRACEDDFDAQYVSYLEVTVAEKNEECATDVKIKLVQIVNEKLVQYLNAMTSAEEKQFSAFAGRVELEIEKVNRAVRNRRKIDN